jgi:hydrogenase maturation protease
MRTLVVGYGNADREDDGVAWHILNKLAKRLGLPESSSPEEGFSPSGGRVELLFVLQLTPELSEIISEFDRVCFVDAHTGRVHSDLHIEEVKSEFQSSPFTHHMTPATSLAISEQLYRSKPEAILVSVRGFDFGFSRSLSEKTSRLAGRAAEHIYNWMEQNTQG